MPRPISSWLSGPESADSPQASGYPGSTLGLPESGPRSLARSGRRVVALLVDWLIAYGLAALAMELGLISFAMVSTAVLVIWFVIGAVSVRLFGFTPGQLALGLMVVSIDGRAGQTGHVGIGRALARGALLALVIPALFSDADGRGLQDRFTVTAVVRR
jgi:uncharacterized RDD family membrane protein YckC